MKDDVKTRWVAALRSGEYRQGNGQLKQTHPDRSTLDKIEYTHCCLGVLCEIAVEDGVIGPDEAHTYSSAVRSFVGQTLFLPEQVVDWAGLTSDNPDVEITEDEYDEEAGEDLPLTKRLALAELNDDHKSFAYLADLIDAQY
jgi:hypothetical protein